MESLAELRTLHDGCSPSCITTSCKGDGGSTLRLPEQGALCISCDHCTCFPREEGQRRPDFVVLYCSGETQGPRWYIIEMKGRVSNIGHIVSQIQAGANVVQTSPCFKVTGWPGGLVPIVAHNRGLWTADFSQKSIKFFGKPYRIAFKRSGSDLV